MPSDADNADLESLQANVILSRLLGADDIWLGDHTKSMFPRAAWGPAMSPAARFMPSLDAYLDPTVTIARTVGRFGPRMGTAVTDPLRRTPADLARVWMSLHHNATERLQSPGRHGGQPAEMGEPHS